MFTIATILIIHFFFDFVFQSHWMATNKSKNNAALALHVAIYSSGVCLMTILNFPLFSFGTACAFIFLNTIWHFLTDYITSRLSSKRWAEQRWHDFFVIIGLDQVCHYLTLFGLLYILTA